MTVHSTKSAHLLSGISTRRFSICVVISCLGTRVVSSSHQQVQRTTGIHLQSGTSRLLNKKLGCSLLLLHPPVHRPPDRIAVSVLSTWLSGRPRHNVPYCGPGSCSCSPRRALFQRITAGWSAESPCRKTNTLLGSTRVSIFPFESVRLHVRQ